MKQNEADEEKINQELTSLVTSAASKKDVAVRLLAAYLIMIHISRDVFNGTDVFLGHDTASGRMTFTVVTNRMGVR
ncbi:hypothetical protein L248_1672 [Schleiferilactobacillus shenzhenensis LY-73]|uniref:Uncharacterized protein n=2 Tax=Schleiferilactobacillus shenzhenensis TaxID=1231337 RepID=U4TKW2_9LACO|nr:hypothetical protein L248_1672 [Schleiferilactobacillus shenzhenensis LY-73]